MKNIEEQFMRDPSTHDPTYKKKEAKELDEEEEELKKRVKFSNQRLMTPRLRKMAVNKDAREVLAEEVNESVLRLQKAKFGHKLSDIVPDHKKQFYLPDKASYFPKDKHSQSSVVPHPAKQRTQYTQSKS